MSRSSMLPPGAKEFNKHVAACAELIKPAAEFVRLQMNNTGAWRNVVDFASHESRRIEQAAVDLFGHDDRVTLRVIVPNSTNPPLMHWSKATGWRVWGDHARQA